MGDAEGLPGVTVGPSVVGCSVSGLSVIVVTVKTLPVGLFVESPGGKAASAYEGASDSGLRGFDPIVVVNEILGYMSGTVGGLSVLESAACVGEEVEESIWSKSPPSVSMAPGIVVNMPSVSPSRSLSLLVLSPLHCPTREYTKSLLL